MVRSFKPAGGDSMADDADRKAADAKLLPAFELLRKIRTIRATNDEQADVYMKAFNAAAGRLRQAGPSEAATRELQETVKNGYLITPIRLAAAQLIADQSKGRESQTIAWLDEVKRSEAEPFRDGISAIIAALHKIELDEIREMTAAVKLPEGPKLNLNL
jgi:hypothetical protein